MPKAKKLPSGNWRAQACRTVNGVRLRKSFTASNRREAELMAATWLTGIEAERIVPITLLKAFESYIAAKENVLSPSTVIGYNTIKRNAFSDIMPLNLENLNLNLVQSSVNAYAKNHSPKSVRNAVGLLTAVLGMFRPEMSLHLTLPQKEKKDIYIPDDEDIKTVFEAAKDTKLEIIILLAALGPMRRGEVCAITDKDIDGNIVTVNKSMVKTADKEWIIKAPKTYSSYRHIEYPDFVIKKLKGITGRITDLNPDAVTKQFLRLLREHNLPKFRFHDLRHYAVSTLHAINVPDKYIEKRGGWSSNYTMNKVYNHTLKSNADSIDKQIVNHFESLAL